MMENITYVTYHPATGELTGAYLQALHPVHAEHHIVVDAEQHANWTDYRANDARDGVELRPLAAPGDPVPTPIPQSVTRRQARQALLLAGLLDDVPLAIEQIPDETQRRMAQIEWEDSLEFVRTRPLVIQIAAAIGLDSAGLDQMFITASTL